MTHCRRLLAVALAGLLAACQTDDSPNPVTSSAVTNPGTTGVPLPTVIGTPQPVAAGRVAAPFASCLISVDLPAAGRTSAIRPATIMANSDYYAVAAELGPYAGMGYECTCEPGVRPELITETVAAHLTQTRMIERQLKISRMSFAENGPLGKTLLTTGTTSSPWGELTMAMQIYYLPRCVVVTWTAVTGQAPTEARGQLETYVKSAKRSDR